MKIDRLTAFNIMLLVLGSVLLLQRSVTVVSLRFPSPGPVDQSLQRGPDLNYEVGFVHENPQVTSVHSGTLTQLKDKSILASWFGGTREGAKDVKIFLSRRESNAIEWSPPKVIASREQSTDDLNRYVKKLGNPILFTDSRERIWLFYVTVSFGGWSGSNISVRYSDDHGQTWSQAKRLITSPLLNLSTLVKGCPIELWFIDK